MNLQKKIGFILEWNFLFRGDIMERNAEYFRELQGVKTIEEQLNEAVEYILNKIEEYIKNGGKDTYLDISLAPYEGIYSIAIDKLREMNFKIYQIVLYNNGDFRFTVSWSY